MKQSKITIPPRTTTTTLLLRSQGDRKKRSQSEASMRARQRRTPLDNLRSDNVLSLTRSQFTATNPLNLFSISPGSTPGGVRVKGRELISVIQVPSVAGGFQTVFPVGLGGSFLALSPVNFPRLNAYTGLYDWYLFHRADLLFQSNQGTTQTGEVLIAVDYDVKDAALTSSVQMMRNITSVMSNIYSDCSCTCLGSLSRLSRFATSQSNQTDPAQLYQAAIYVATEGFVAPTIMYNVGYLVVQYDVEFYAPH
jgi:hypothetical protein